MKLPKIIRQLPLILLVLTFCFSCARQMSYTSPGAVEDGKYDMAYPFGGDSNLLKGILESVRMVNATVYYEQYTFSREEDIHAEDITPTFILSVKDRKRVYNDFRVGTATLIHSSTKRIAVMTCDHVVNFPDTVFSYFPEKKATKNPKIHQIAFKRRQENFITDIRQGDAFKILISDPKLDIAILGKDFLYYSEQPPPVFKYPLGKAEDLDWGSLLYLVGFPSGKKMITTGIVSSPNRNQRHDFLLDALFNRGFSGGLALAVRDGLPNFELVGIVNAVAADNDWILTPGRLSATLDPESIEYYDGPIYVAQSKKINYGISFGISVESIQEFIKRHSSLLSDYGFQPDQFFQYHY